MQRRRRSLTRLFFFFNDTATTEIYTLSLHDALPIYRYVRKRFPNSSKDKLGSQHAAPRLSLFAMILLAQVMPPSKLTAANIPAAGTTTLVTITILLGLVGLTAMASSDSVFES